MAYKKLKETIFMYYKKTTLAAGAVLIALGLTALSIVVVAGLSYAIWNFLVVAAFKLPMATWLQAFTFSVVVHFLSGLFSKSKS